MNCNTTHYRANSSSVPGDPTNLPRVKHAAHSLKGLISNFGAARAVSAAIKLECMVQQRRPAADLESAFRELQSAVDELQEALAPYAARAGTSV